MSAPSPGLNGPVEPSAETRQAANALRQMYVALIEQGFTQDEAMGIIGISIAAAIRGDGS